MSTYRPLVALILSLVLVAASGSLAVARAQAAMTTDLVICAAAGAVTVTLDAQGNPVTPPPDCQHCLAASAPALPPGPPILTRPLVVTCSRTTPPAPQTVRACAPPAAPARAPPVLSA